METNLDSATVDALLRSRSVARRSTLLEQARGKQGRLFLAWGMLLIAAGGAYLYWVKVSSEALIGIMLFCGISGWFENRLSRRLDAMVRLLEEISE